MFNPNKVTRDDQNRPQASMSVTNTMALVIEIDHDVDQVLWRLVTTDGKEKSGSSCLEWEFMEDRIEAFFEAMGNRYYLFDFLAY